MNNDIAVISTFFNPLKYKNRYETYLRFQDFIYDCGLKDHFYISELLYDEEEPFIKHENVIRFKVKDIFWHKERALNLTAKILPKQYSKIIWVDADVIWFSKNWWKKVSKLDEYNIIQPYSHCQNLNKNFSLDRKYKSQIYSVIFYNKNTSKQMEYGAPGGSMAYKREFFENIGLYDRCIVGGGDYKSIYSIFGLELPMRDKSFDFKINEYANIIKKYIGNKYYYLDEIMYHLYHGRKFERQYSKRYQLIKNFNFYDLCEEDENGLYKFKSTVTNELKLKFINYFKNRNEDWEPLIIPLYKPYLVEHSKNNIFKWMPPECEYELHNIKSIKLQICRMGNALTTPYLNVISNGKFKQYLLNLDKDTEIVIPISEKKGIFKLILIGKGFIPEKVFINNSDVRKLSYVINNVKILQHDKEEFEDYPVDAM